MGRFTRDWQLKLLALIGASAFWILVATLENPGQDQAFQDVQLTPIGLGSGLVIVNAVPNVAVRVHGPGAVLRTLRPSSFQATIDLQGLKPGLHRVQVMVRTVASGAVTISDVGPATLDLLIDTVGTRTVPVRVTYIDLAGLPDGYALGTPVIQPSTVLLEGPQSVIQAYAAVEASVDVTGARSDIVRNVAVVLRDSHGIPLSNVAAYPPVVVIDVPVKAATVSRELPVKPDLVGSLPPGSYIEHLAFNPLTLTVTGTAAALEHLSSVSLQALDLAALPPGTSQVTLAAVPPAPNVTVTPGHVVALLSIAAPTGQRTFLFFGLAVTGLEPGLQASSPQLSGALTLAGSPDRLAAMGQSELDLHLDVSGLAPSANPYSVPVVFTLPAGLTIVSITPSSAPVTISRRG